jgi:hypothetical protein
VSEPATRCQWLETLLPRLDSDSFKIVYFLVQRGGDSVRLSFADVEKIGISRWIARRCLKVMAAQGVLLLGAPAVPAAHQAAAYTVVGLPAVQAAPKPKPKAELAKEDPEYAAVWDTLHALRGIIAEPLTHSIVRRALEIGDAWNRTGFQTSAMLYNRQKFQTFPGKEMYRARKWIYHLNGLRQGFIDQANEEREQKRQLATDQASKAELVISIEAPPLPLREDSRQFVDDLASQIGRLARAKSAS